MPDPWQWTPCQFGPFPGRWDDPHSIYRVLYTGASRYACLLEVLAVFRPDPALIAADEGLDADDRDHDHPGQPLGRVPADWLPTRAVGEATLSGRYVAVGEDDTLAWLRPQVVSLLVAHGLADLDGSTIRLTSPRPFTQDLSRWLYEHSEDTDPVDGIEYESRHGNRLLLWATFEHPDDGTSSHHLRSQRHAPLTHDDPDLIRAMERHGLILDR